MTLSILKLFHTKPHVEMSKLTTAIWLLSSILFSCENGEEEKHQKKEKRVIIIEPDETKTIHPLELPTEREEFDFQKEFETLKKRNDGTSYRDCD